MSLVIAAPSSDRLRHRSLTGGSFGGPAVVQTFPKVENPFGHTATYQALLLIFKMDPEVEQAILADVAAVLGRF